MTKNQTETDADQQGRARAIELEIVEALNHLGRIRSFWSMTEDPGLGDFELSGGYLLRVLEREEDRKGKAKDRRTYMISSKEDPRNPITLASDWKIFSENLSKRDEEEFFMVKLSINDRELREKIRLKCKNDWNLDLTEDQVSMCIIEMEEQRLSLFHNQIWPNRRSWQPKGSDEWLERITWDKTIDGYRAVAHRSGRFAGVDAASFEVDADDQLIARITVYALDSTGKPRPYVGEARFNEFVQMVPVYVKGKRTKDKVPNNQWSDSPHNQLAVAAERQALRKAFQDLDEEPRAFVYSPEQELEPEHPVASQAPEPELEESRGIPEPPPPEKALPPKLKEGGGPNRKRSDEKTEPDEQLKYVGFPKGGFQEFKKYNSDERIVMVVCKGDIHYLALDSGFKVSINKEGYEVSRSNRSDEVKGGRKWGNGDAYYDGAVVEAIADSKKDELSLWLALDNGFKVLLDRWGKETKRKERKKSKTKAPVDAEPVASAPKDAQPVPASTSKSAQSPEEESGDIDPESVDTVEAMRKIANPLLKKWFKVAGRSMSPKDAFGHFTGVVLAKGQAMTLDDYKVLYDYLQEALNEA